MKTKALIQDMKRIVEVNTNVGTSCDHCAVAIGMENFQNSVNHYINDHGYKLLHVGTETTFDSNGAPWQCTVAILGHPDPPPLKQSKLPKGIEEFVKARRSRQ